MKLYNIHMDAIGKYNRIINAGTTYIVNKLSEMQLNALGYYNIVSESPHNRRYYINTQTKSLIDNKYTIGYTFIEKTLFDIQLLMLSDLRIVYEEKVLRPLIDTGLGYNVFGGQLDVIEMQDAKDNAETTIIDSDSNEQTVDGTIYTTIANAVKSKRNMLRVAGKTKVSEVKALATVAECINYEHEAYDYIVTQEDVDNDSSGTLVLDQIIVRYINNITDWD